MKKATLDSLIERKLKRAKESTHEIEIKSLGMSFTVEKLPLTQVLSIMDSFKGDDSYTNQFGMFKELVYMSVPLFRSQKLLDAYEVHDPSDIVTCILDDNINAITEFANGILDLYGLNNGTAGAELKN